MSDQPALRAEGLRKDYGSVQAVSAVDLTVQSGTVLGFLGPNGAGKTTVIRILSTVLRPDAGAFTVAGIPHVRPVEIRRRIGVLPESAGYPAGQTGEEWLRLHARLFGQGRADARVTARRLLADVGLGDRGGSLISAYSRGMRQRLGIARALINDPAVIFLDEPTLGLDPGGQAQVLDLVRRVARLRGVTVVLSTHLLAEVETSCDRVVILNHGRIVAQGTVSDVARSAAAPRRAIVRVPSGLVQQAMAALDSVEHLQAMPDSADGQVVLTMPSGGDPEVASAAAMRTLLEEGIPVLGYELEGGRLSDAFLAVTREQP